MNLVRRKRQACDPFKDFFETDHPFLGLSLFPFASKDMSPWKENWNPALDISEDKEKIIVKADIPGLKKEDIQVSLDNTLLTIRGERKSADEKKEKNYHRIERSYGVFERRVDLGTTVDQTKVRASYKDGVLQLELPKSENAKSKQITIQ